MRNKLLLIYLFEKERRSEGFLFLFVFYYVEAMNLIGWLMTLEADGDWLKFRFVSFFLFYLYFDVTFPLIINDLNFPKLTSSIGSLFHLAYVIPPTRNCIYTDTGSAHSIDLADTVAGVLALRSSEKWKTPASQKRTPMSSGNKWFLRQAISFVWYFNWLHDVSRVAGAVHENYCNGLHRIRFTLHTVVYHLRYSVWANQKHQFNYQPNTAANGILLEFLLGTTSAARSCYLQSGFEPHSQEPWRHHSQGS